MLGSTVNQLTLCLPPNYDHAKVTRGVVEYSHYKGPWSREYREVLTNLPQTPGA